MNKNKLYGAPEDIERATNNLQEMLDSMQYAILFYTKRMASKKIKIQHFVLYENIPTDGEIEQAYEELKYDASLGMSKIVKKLKHKIVPRSFIEERFPEHFKADMKTEYATYL